MTTPIEGVVAPGFEAVRDAFAQNLADGLDHGVGFAALRDGETLVDLVGGWADAARTRPYTARSLTPIFSVTKAMTAFLIMRLVERGALALEAPIAESWPEFASGGKERVTLAHVLSHQAGVPGVARPMTTSDLIAHTPFAEAIAAEPAYWPPGEAAAYHGVTAGHLLNELVRRRTGRSIGRWFADEIAAPHRLDLFIGLPAERAADAAEAIAAPGVVEERAARAEAFPRARDSILNPPLTADRANDAAMLAAEIPGAGGVGAALSVARAMHLALHPEGGLLSAQSRAHLTTVQVDALDCLVNTPLRLSLGLMLNDAERLFGPSDAAAGHTGWGGAFGFFDPDRRVAVGFAPTRLLPNGPDLIRRRERLFAALFAAL